MDAKPSRPKFCKRDGSWTCTPAWLNRRTSEEKSTKTEQECNVTLVWSHQGVLLTMRSIRITTSDTILRVIPNECSNKTSDQTSHVRRAKSRKWLRTSSSFQPG